MNTVELKKQRADKLAEARKIVAHAEGENRDMSPEEKANFDSLMGEVNSLKSRVDALEAIEANEGEEPAQDAARAKRSVSPVNFPNVTISKESNHRYSLARAASSWLEKDQLSGFEREVSDELARNHHKQPEGFLIPLRGSKSTLTRAFDTSAGTGAVPTYWENDLIELLRNKMVCVQLGAKVYENLPGATRFPRQSTAGTAYYVAESGNLTASAQAIDYVSLSPHTLGAYTDISRRMLITSNINVEGFVQEDLTRDLAIAMDLGGLNGQGTNQPTGILQDSNVPTYVVAADSANGGALAYADLLGMAKTVDNANALQGSPAYVTNPKVYWAAKNTPKIGSTFPEYLIDANNKAAGFDIVSTLQVPSNLTKGSGSNLSAMIFGNWEDCMFGTFGSGVEVLIDPYTGGAAGAVRIRLMMDYDFAVRHGGSFCKAVDLIAS